MQTWLVTGANGILGANAGVFLQGRADTVGVWHNSRPRPELFRRVLNGNLEDVNNVRAILDSARPDVILHCAAQSRHKSCESDPDQAWRINVDGTRTLAHLANEYGSQFIYISTDAVFDGAHGVYSEEAHPNPFSVYGHTKLAGEEAARDECDALIVRTNFFGWSPSGKSSILEFFFNALSAGQRVKGYTDFHVTSMYAHHLLEAIWRLQERRIAGLVHVASQDSLSKYEFALELADIFGFNSNLIEPSSENEEPREWVRGRDISLDTSRYEKLTGFVLPTQREGLMKALVDSQTMPHWLRPGLSDARIRGNSGSEIRSSLNFERGGS